MSSPRPFLIGFRATQPAHFAPALAALGGRVVLALPRSAIVLAPDDARDALARLPGVVHAGGVNLPQRTVPRLRFDPDGRPLPMPRDRPKDASS
ncbi:hypothetical protein ACQW02_12245 [Humitalea sp. 24SJ18S-53]|uniref:hypothetical protein n=1 Tax=Humitalea sp. 24SJ18S-53 TaxID=3422307 RepID=UPI003D6663AB